MSSYALAQKTKYRITLDIRTPYDDFFPRKLNWNEILSLEPSEKVLSVFNEDLTENPDVTYHYRITLVLLALEDLVPYQIVWENVLKFDETESVTAYVEDLDSPVRW